MRAKKVDLDCDLCADSFFGVCATLGTLPEDTIIYCGFHYLREAVALRNEFCCEIVLLPIEILKDLDHWCVRSKKNGDTIWSPGS